LAAAAWRQRGRSGRLHLVDCCLFLPPPLLLLLVSLLPPWRRTYPRGWKTDLGFCDAIEHKLLLGLIIIIKMLSSI
jgi:hypothetical protein